MCYASVTMASKPPISSSLNPNAPAFVPASYLAAEDFSPEWYRLIQTSTSFREWWMKENEPSAVTAAATAKEEPDLPDFDDIDELLELGFRSDVLDDWDDHQAPVVPQVQPPAQQQRQQQVVQQQYPRQQYPRQQQQPSQWQNEHRNLSAVPSHRLRTAPASESTGAVGYQSGTFPKGGKPQ